MHFKFAYFFFFLIHLELKQQIHSYTAVFPSKTIPNSRPKWAKCIYHPFSDQKGTKTICTLKGGCTWYLHGFITPQVSLLYTAYWQMVPLSHTSLESSIYFKFSGQPFKVSHFHTMALTSSKAFDFTIGYPSYPLHIKVLPLNIGH